jgi:lambda family phage portal protein
MAPKVGQAHWLERSIEALSPRWALSRNLARQGLEHARAYEAGSRSKRLQYWRAGDTGANSEIASALPLVRARARDLERNNTYFARGLRVRSSNIVGTGILATPQSGRDADDKLIADRWKLWADTTLCDARGRTNLYGLQALAMRSIDQAGEVLVRRVWAEEGEELPIPFRLQVLEPDFIDSGKTESPRTGNQIVQGVEIDAYGRAVAYWLFHEHPGERFFGWAGQSFRVPATDLLHVYHEDRIGQVRGITRAAPAIVRLRDFEDVVDARIMQAKVAACFGVFVRSAPGFDLGSTPSTEPNPKDKSLVDQRLTPGMIRQLPLGTDISVVNPPAFDGFVDFAKITLRSIAGCLDLTYASLSGDLESVNYSSGKLGWIDQLQATEQTRWLMFIPGFLDPIYGWVTESLRKIGRVAEPRSAVKWTPPRRTLLDPSREIPAMVKAMRGGLTSLSETLRELGYDPKTVIRELANDRDLVAQSGLKLEAFTDQASSSGAPAQKSTSAVGKKKTDADDEDDDEEE